MNISLRDIKGAMEEKERKEAGRKEGTKRGKETRREERLQRYAHLCHKSMGCIRSNVIESSLQQMFKY